MREFRFRPIPCDDQQDGDSSDGEPRECDQVMLASTKKPASRAATSTSLWNVDGELVEQAAISVRYACLLNSLIEHVTSLPPCWRAKTIHFLSPGK